MVLIPGTVKNYVQIDLQALAEWWGQPAMEEAFRTASKWSIFAHYTGSAADRPVQLLSHVVGVDPGPVRIGKITVSQRFLNPSIIFITRKGKTLNRSYIWAQMKKLCRDAGVKPSKVFSHNLRKLFARTIYGIEKDITKLADILGHTSFDTTRIYIVTISAEYCRQIERLDLGV